MAKLANKTHKDRVNEFNAHLESLSEHHDIPKVTGFGIIVKFGSDFEHHLGGTRIIRYFIYLTWGRDKTFQKACRRCVCFLHDTW